MKTLNRNRTALTAALLLGCLLLSGAAAAQNKALTVTDIMKFKEIAHESISDDGRYAAWEAQPGRGNPEAVIHSLADGSRYVIPRGSRPLLSSDGRWAAAALLPDAAAVENLKKGEKKPKNGLVLLDTAAGDTLVYDQVSRYTFSPDARWLVLHRPAEPAEGAKLDKKAGAPLLIIDLASKESRGFDFVTESSFDSTSSFLAFCVRDTAGHENGAYALDLKKEGLPVLTLAKEEKSLFSGLAWHHPGRRAAFLASAANDDFEPRDTRIIVYDFEKERQAAVIDSEPGPADRVVYHRNTLRWSQDGKRLFFGLKPKEQIPSDKKSDADSSGLFDVDAILKDRGVDVWHWNDDYINSQQKKMWPRLQHRTYTAIWHRSSGRVVQLADLSLPDVRIPANSRHALGTSDLPYRKQQTWGGGKSDIYLVSLSDGSRELLMRGLEGSVSLSPEGGYLVWYSGGDWYVRDLKKNVTRNVTEQLQVPFCDEDHDYPSPVPGYGTAGWTAGDGAVLIYDKYDIWKIPLKGGSPVNITAGRGRSDGYTFRIVRTGRSRDFFAADETLLVSAYHNKHKNYGFYQCSLSEPGVTRLIEDDKKFTFRAKAADSGHILYTRESYREFPDLHAADGDFSGSRKISDVNPQIADFAWGGAELVEWSSADGIPLQGVLIKPGNYEPGKRYPVLVYYYRFFSQRLHEFNQMVINHRPNFPFYASNGYAVFLPDVRFDVGLPGPAAVKCLVPGVQKLIDMGVADPQAVALHGHSWSGYQSSFVITRTNLFACAVAGAPVSNMTSAYSGIRLESGMARQFQYERSQSRIGQSLWERRDLYIENSPVFFADRIETPLLIMFGDEDGAVPWQQGVELYLAMRRLEKDCVFLQYRGEPHHPQKFANKLDYTLKMKAYIDHYCKGAPAPAWLSEGEPYQGN